MTKKRPTIIDVARKAGVSKSTVSLVLQNSASVRAETQNAVRQAIRDIGYVYNRAAANMRKSNTSLVGLVINDLRNPFFTEFATSLQMSLAERGYCTVVANTDENTHLQDQVVASMIEHGVSALLICPAYGETTATFDRMKRAGIPALQMLRCVDDRLALFPFAAPEYPRGSEIATQHLIACGARRIAFLGGLPNRAVTEERKTGYLKALEAAGIPPLILTGKPNRAFGRTIVEQLFEQHGDVNAVLCFNDLVALGVLSGCQEHGRNVGSDFKIVGFDDIEEAANAFPALTTVRCDITGIGAKAAATMVRWLEEGIAPAQETRMPVQLVVRTSSLGGGG